MNNNRLLQINKFHITPRAYVLTYKVSCRNKQYSQIFAYINRSFSLLIKQTSIPIRVGNHIPRFLSHFLFIRIKNIYSAETIKIFSYNNPIVLANPRSRGKILLHPIKLATGCCEPRNLVHISSFSSKKRGGREEGGREGREKKKEYSTDNYNNKNPRRKH